MQRSTSHLDLLFSSFIISILSIQSRKRPTPQSVSNVDPAKRMATWPQSNGHPESKQLVNGCVLETTSNGLTKGLVGLMTHPASSGQTNGTVTQAQTSPVKLTTSALSPCPKLNELVSREHGLVLFPVFTTLSFNPTASPVSSNHVENAVSEVPQSASSPDGPVTSTGMSQSRLTLPVLTDAINHDHGIVKSMPVTPKSILTSRPVLARKTPAISSAHDISSLFVCHWNTCSCLFKDLNTLLVHLWSEHLSNLAVKQPVSCIPGPMNRITRFSSLVQAPQSFIMPLFHILLSRFNYSFYTIVEQLSP